MILKYVFITIACISVVLTDIPAHCLITDVKGDWIIQLENKTFKPELTNEQTNCGHGFPNHVEKEDKDYSIADPIEFKIRLDFKNKVLDLNDKEIGSFTMIYDEGFLINIKNQLTENVNAEIFFHSKYVYRNGQFESECDKTMRGWYIPDVNKKRENWSCSYAYKINKIDSVKKEASFAQISEHIIKNTINNSLHPEAKYEDMHEYVSELNQQSLTWEAGLNNNFVGLQLKEIYSRIKGSKRQNKVEIESFLSKENKVLPNSSFIQTKIKSLNKKSNLKKFLAGSWDKESASVEYITRNNSIKRDLDSINVTDEKEIGKYFDTKIEDIDIETLPLNWSWTNVGGVNYVSDVRNQGDCGSCYAIATVTCLESRLRIRTFNKDKTQFSLRYPLSCGLYTEGCDGGYPILLGKFFNEFDILPQDCMEGYDEQTGPCKNICDTTKYKRRYFAKSYEYIGGAYGKSTEVDMMKELRARGPIPGNIRVPGSFMFYKGGVYSDDYSVHKNNDKWSLKSMYSQHIYKLQVDHSTTIVGYGEQNGLKYWICQNSWGQEWGLNGRYKVVRGENSVAVESMGDFVEIGWEDK